jgi:hypothetical protein
MPPTLLEARGLTAIRRYEHPHAYWPDSWHDICSPGLGRKEYWRVSCSKGPTYEAVSHILDYPDSGVRTRPRYSPEYMDTHNHTSSVHVCVICPGACTCHGCGGPAVSAQRLVLSLDAGHGHECYGCRAGPGMDAVPQVGRGTCMFPVLMKDPFGRLWHPINICGGAGRDAALT